MRVIRERLPKGERVLALGTFDGLHCGHCRLIQEAAACARERGIPLRVCTFDRHPLSVVHPEAAPGLLSTLPEKLRLMARQAPDEVQILPFSARMAGMEPEAFLSALCGRRQVRDIFVGWNYTFGRGGRGNPALLRSAGAQLGFETHVLSPVRTEAGRIVSSTAIREMLASGRVEEAAAMLGAPYTMTGVVKEGGAPEQGRIRLAFPAEKLLPAPGSYTCRTEDRRHSGKGQLRVAEDAKGHRIVEINDFTGPVWEAGQPVRVTLLERIRGPLEPASLRDPEQDGLDALKRLNMA